MNAIHRLARLTLVVLGSALCVSSAHAQRSQPYTDQAQVIVDQFERIQASLEVAFRPDDYIGSLQTLRYQINKLDESFAAGAESHYASYMILHRVEDTYLSLVKKMREGDGTPPNEAIDSVSTTNQTQVQLLKTALAAERTGGGEAGWNAVIEAYFNLQDYNRAVAMAELAAKAYPDSPALQGKLEEVRGRIDGIRANLTETHRLIENGDYQGALTVLKQLEVDAANDATVKELRHTVDEALAKIEGLRNQALDAEKKGDLKQAFKTWSALLEIEPGNEEAAKKIEQYKDQFKIVTRRVYQTCANCGGTGDCEVCKGSKVCLVCNGYGRCLACQGRGYYATTCMYCLCRACMGTGRCATCGGDGLVYCPQCHGQGYFTVKEARTCPVCQGSGKLRFSNSACPNCSGTGKVMVNVDKPCPRCGGRKVERCTQCNGTGICPVCKGRGRAETCSFCKGLGRIITECPYCKGTGICLTCDGKGTCRFCKGTGRCSVCVGKGIVVQDIEEELLRSEDAGTLAVTSEPSAAALSLDGKPIGTTPLSPQKIDPGTHAIRIAKDGFTPVELQVEANGDTLVEVNATLIPAERYNLRVLAVTPRRYRVLFKHYTKRDDGSFLASVTVDGSNRWLKKDEYLLGMRVAEVEEITHEQYNSTIGGTKVLDVSKLVLVNRSGERTELTLGVTTPVNSYTAKLYDKELNAALTVREGNRFGERLVKSITDERVVLVDRDGVELTLPVKP
jgi:tetratricopeptide (TPR) repeat protein